MWRRSRNVHVLLHVRAYGECPVSLAMTHMRWVHGQGGHESTGYTFSVVLMSVGGKPGLSIGARNKDAGKRERKTPAPCATYRQREREKERKKERKRVAKEL